MPLNLQEMARDTVRQICTELSKFDGKHEANFVLHCNHTQLSYLSLCNIPNLGVAGDFSGLTPPAPPPRTEAENGLIGIFIILTGFPSGGTGDFTDEWSG